MSAFDAVRAELDRLGALDTVEGQLALGLATMVDNGATGATVGAASNAKQCRELIESLRVQRPTVKTQLELIRDRDANRHAG